MAKEKKDITNQEEGVEEVQTPIIVKMDDPSPVVELTASKDNHVIIAQRGEDGNAIAGTEFEVSEYTARIYDQTKYVIKKK